MDVPADPQQALARAVQELYAAPAAEFVATRTALARELRAAKHREVAKELGAMRKPSVSAAAVNALVRDEDAVVVRLVDLGGAMRHATSALDGKALAALRSDRDELLRDWVRAAAEHAEGALTAAVEAEVRDTAVAALADAAATEVVTSGHLTRALSYSGFGEVDLADAVARTSTGVVLTRIEGGRVDEEDGLEDAEGLGRAADVDGGDEDAIEDDEADEDLDDQEDLDDEEDREDADADADEEEEEDGIEDDEADELPHHDVDALEMELDEAEKVVAAARAERRRAAAAETQAEDEVRTAAEVVARAEEALREARAELTAAEESHARAQDGLTQAQQGRAEAEEALQAARRRRDGARVALEEAEDA